MTLMDPSPVPYQAHYPRRLNLAHNEMTDESSELSFLSTLANCKQLRRLVLEGNPLNAILPISIGNLSTALHNLTTLLLDNSELDGSIADTVARLQELQVFRLQNNQLEGFFPNGTCSLRKLGELALSHNNLIGSIPQCLGDFCIRNTLTLWSLTDLFDLNLSSNSLTGHLPSGIGKLKQKHSFDGPIPESFGNLIGMEALDLSSNKPSGPIPKSLEKLQYLKDLDLSSNRFRGEIPSGGKFAKFTALSFVGNDGLCSASLLQFPKCKTSTHGTSHKLRYIILAIILTILAVSLRLNLAHNEMTDESSELSFLSTLANCKQLRRLVLEGNPLNAILPISIGNLSTALHNLTTLLLDNSELDGSIADTVARLQELQVFRLQNNQLEGFFPNGTCSLRKLGELALSHNNLIGSIPQCLGDFYIRNTLTLWSLTDLFDLNLSSNSLTGHLPSGIGKLKQKHSFDGPIPESFGNLIGMEALDLSSNKPSGPIPKSLEKLQYLKDLDLSSNRFRGEIPSGGNFAKFTALSFVGNDGLCSASLLQFPKCKTSTHGTSHKLRYIILAIILTILAVSLVILLLRCQKGTRKLQNLMDAVETWQRFSYNELEQATDGFCKSNLLGTGVLAQYTRDVCSNIDAKILVQEYIPNGNLHKWLYAHNNFLDILQRLDIMIDVATALEYLHHGFDQPIVYCNLKPSNVLLDSNMVAHVGDFGIARLIGDMDSVDGTNGIVSLKSDVYSFGFLMMETFTKKAPTDEFFVGEMSLKQYVSEALPDRVAEIADSNLPLQEQNLSAKKDCLLSVLRLAVEC
ncbi:hypothetical protein Tsubulata_036717, partial [Turnera subulata]